MAAAPRADTTPRPVAPRVATPTKAAAPVVAPTKSASGKPAPKPAPKATPKPAPKATSKPAPKPAPKATSKPAPKNESGNCKIKGNISSKGEKIYHVPGGRSYDKTVIDTSKGERWFCSTSQAEAAGWRAAKA